MTVLTETAPRRSAFAAAFLSFIFPGLGQVYAGDTRRGLAFAAAPLLVLAGFAGLFVHYGPTRFGLWLVQSQVLLAIFVMNIVMLAYRAVAIYDAYRLVGWGNGFATVPAGLRRSWPTAEPASLLGLIAIFAVLLAGHLALARWDRVFYDFVVTTHNPDITGIPGAAQPSQAPKGNATAPPQANNTPWNGTDRLNILLVGVDARPQQQVFNTDSMIVVSIDPKTKKVAMLSLPRDVLGLPTPPNSDLSTLFGPTFNNKINDLWTETDARRDLFPEGGAQALKEELGYVMGLDIQYYVEVNFTGFQKVVDTFGGVNIKVDSPVVDEEYPGAYGDHLRIYIEPGLQHMTGAQALIYARSRHGSNDFDRASRQQKVLTALKSGADLNAISTNLVPLINAMSQTVHTDLPEGPDVVGSLVDLAGQIKSSDIKSMVFAPPTYGIEHNDPQLYWIQPDVAKIQAAVQAALNGTSPSDQAAQLQAAVAEQAPITVENGTGTSGQAAAVTAYLTSIGLNATTSTTRPSQLGGQTQIEAVNGAETQFPATAQLIATQFGKPASAVTISGATPGFIVITGTDTPALTPAPS